MKTLLALTRDLFFMGKIQAAVTNLPNKDWQAYYVRTENEFERELNITPISLILIDLQASQVDTLRLIKVAQNYKIPVIAFGRHTEPQKLREARQAGALRAVPNSTLVEKFATLLEQATNPNTPPVSIEDDL